MKTKIIYCDEKRVFCKADEQRGFLILFQRPNGTKDSDCELYFNDICDTLSRQEATSVSDLVESTSWKDEVKTTIENSLYIQPFDDRIRPIQGFNIIKTFSGSFEEISLKGSKRIVAKFAIKPKKSIWRYLFLAAALLAIAGGAFLIMDKYENNRMADNQVAYNEDITRINALREKLDDARSPKNSFSKYISDYDLKRINQSLDSMQACADNSFKAVSEKGKYKHVDIDKTGIDSQINSIIENAKLNYSKEEERGRINSNDSLYRHDIEMIQYWRNRLSRISIMYFSGKSNLSFKPVNQKLDSLNKLADTNFNRVKESGDYVPIQLDSTKMESLIQKLIPKKKSNASSSHRQANMTSGNNSHSHYTFSQLVKSADANFQSYYHNKNNKAAARRAIQDYSEALKIKYHYNVSKRLRMLQKELQQ